MIRTWLLFLCALVTMTGASKLSSPTSGPTLKKVTEFDLPGPPGKRFDYLTIDADDHYLISAHLGADQTYVIDLGTNKVLATIKDTPEMVEGVFAQDAGLPSDSPLDLVERLIKRIGKST